MMIIKIMIIVKFGISKVLFPRVMVMTVKLVKMNMMKMIMLITSDNDDDDEDIFQCMMTMVTV